MLISWLHGREKQAADVEPRRALELCSVSELVLRRLLSSIGSVTEKPETNVTAKPPEETDTCKGLVPSFLFSSSKFILNHKQTHQPLGGFALQVPGMWVTECDLVYEVADTVPVLLQVSHCAFRFHLLPAVCQ